jgi:hypothetical protein
MNRRPSILLSSHHRLPRLLCSFVLVPFSCAPLDRHVGGPTVGEGSVPPKAAPAAPARAPVPEPPVPIHICLDRRELIFPDDWYARGIAPLFGPVPSVASEVGRQATSEAMAMYPPELLKTHLDAVYIVGSMRVGRMHPLGTNSRRRIYIAASWSFSAIPLGDPKSALSYEVKKTFHHELACILLRYHPELLDSQAWEAANPTGFRYFGDDMRWWELGHGGSEYDARLNAQGFLFDASRACLEEDFMYIVQELFAGSHTLWNVKKAYPALSKKIDLAIAFYGKLSDQFTEQYFRDLAFPPSGPEP